MKITAETKIKDVLKIGESLADSLITLAPEFAQYLKNDTKKAASGQFTVRQAAQIAQIPLTEALFVLNLSAGAKTEEIADELNSFKQEDFKYPDFSVERDENLNFAPDFSKPLELLVHWHSRMTTKMENLIRAGEKLKTATENEQKYVLFEIEIARNYLLSANAKHKQDEEISLFPRLRERQNDIGASIIAALNDLEAEHQAAEEIEYSLNETIDRLTGETPVEAADIEIFNDLAKGLLEFYRPHLRLENESIYPAARQFLSDEDLQQIGQEMRERRIAAL